METYIHPDRLDYTGDQLHSLFNYQLSGYKGDSIIAFVGVMDVGTDHLVDMEDAIALDCIWSPEALNFIIEIFHINIETAVLYQRSFMNIVKDCLLEIIQEKNIVGFSITLKGDDIMVACGPTNSNLYKLSVSIATVSHVSGLIHTGLNITTDSNIPVDAIGLLDILVQRENIEKLIDRIMYRFSDFVESVKEASVKVKGV